MINSKYLLQWVVTTAIVLLGLGGLAWGVSHMARNTAAPVVIAKESDREPEADQDQQDTKISVKIVHPQKGATERLSTQPGSIQAFESVRLFAKVPGFLKKQNVDIGDRVKRDQVLAVVDVPELQTQVRRNGAAVSQARSRVVQMKARVSSAKADLDAARAAVTQAEATAKSSAAWVRFRALQFQRMKDLFATKSIEEKLVDESKERYEASVETELAARAAITTTKAKVVACDAKIDQAQADVVEAEAEVEVTQAELEKAQVQVAFATVTAPFDGVIASRGFFPGDYIRSANDGGNSEPLLTVQRTDLMRVVVQIPDRDVPFTDPGDTAEVLIDALPGLKFSGKVARIGRSEDPQTRLMRVEIDLPNPTGKICHGMYGQVTIVLDQEKNVLSIPSSCLVGKQEDGMSTVYVVRDGQVHQACVTLGINNGLRVVVMNGLKLGDEVVLQPSNALFDGAEVTIAK